MIKNIVLFLFLTVGVGFQGIAWSQGIKPAGLNAYAGAGYVEYSISAPATNFKMDRGVFASIAGEKGSSAIFNEEEYMKCTFVEEALSDETKIQINENGLRNIAIMSIAPTGSISNIVLSYKGKDKNYIGV